jgi:C1A family cysteine protease
MKNHTQDGFLFKMTSLTKPIDPISLRQVGKHIVLNHLPSKNRSSIKPCNICLNEAEHEHEPIQAIASGSTSSVSSTLTRQLQAVTPPKVIKTPSVYTLVGSTPYKITVLNQGILGSCVANAFSSSVQHLVGVLPSRLYLYFNGRVGTGYSNKEDSGLDLSDSLPIFTSYALPPESLWAYIPSNFSRLPPNTTYNCAPISSKKIKYTAILQTDTNIMNSIYLKNPVIFGIYVFTSFLTIAVAKTGLIPLPNPTKEAYQGGHCIFIIGWTKYQNVDYYIIQNSWGTNWGNTGSTTLVPNNGTNGGYAYIPKSYVLNPTLAFELFSISAI